MFAPLTPFLVHKSPPLTEDLLEEILTRMLDSDAAAATTLVRAQSPAR